MNRKISKVFAIATIATTLGILTEMNNVKADVNSGDATSIVTSTNTNLSSTESANTATKSAAVSAVQSINIPDGYTLEAVRNVHNQSDADKLQKVAINGVYNNNYQSNADAANERVDIQNLTDQQTNEMNQYAINLVNQTRAQFGEQPFTQNDDTIKAVKNMALEYQNKNESLMNGGWHDPEILKDHSENIAALQIYLDNISGLRARPFAEALGRDFANTNSVPLFTVNNMDDLQALIYYGFIGMLFNDADDLYGHAQNFLTNYQSNNNMAVYPSLIIGTGEGKYSNGQKFPFKLLDIDMHYIWAGNNSKKTDNGWQYQNGNYVYYQDGQPLVGRQYISLPTINGVGTSWYLVNNGVVQTKVQQWMGTYYYFDPVSYLRVDNNYVQSQWGLWYMFGNNGQIVTGKYNWQGNVYYFDPSSYLKVVNDYRATEPDGRGILLGSDGAALSGVQQWMGTYYYFDPVTKLRVDNAYVKSQWGLWYMFGSNGQIVTGPYNWQGSTYYFDPSSYLRVENQFRAVNGVTHYFNDQGIIQDDSLVARWESLINGYQGHHIMIAVQSQNTGNIHEYTNTPGYRLITASTVKVAVLALLLHNTNGNLSAYQQQLAANMIRNSDNNATTTLINNYLGGTAGLQAIFSALGMNQTNTAANGHWAQTLTTATDQLKLLNEIFIKTQSDYLNENSRNYIKSLMSSVNSSQTWGISAGSSQYYIKNGWSALAAPWPWFVNSIGFIPGTNNDGYTIAVYTDNNLPMSVGVNMIESLARATKEMGVQ